jgi:hypothetical protein
MKRRSPKPAPIAGTRVKASPVRASAESLFAEGKFPSAVAGDLGLTHAEASRLYQLWLRREDR